jgi:hypothetical protein
MGQKTKCDSTSDCTRFSDWISISSSETELVQWGEGGWVAQAHVVFGVESGLSTVHLPVGQWTANFQCKLFSLFLFFFFFFLVQGEGGLKAKSSQVSDMFPKEFPIALDVFRVTLCVSAIDHS